MTTEARGTDKTSTIRIRKILVPIDGSEFSLHAIKYAIKIAKDENAQIICIHVISTIVLEYAPPEYREDIKKKVESRFSTIKGIAETSAIPRGKDKDFHGCEVGCRMHYRLCNYREYRSNSYWH